jgi:hydroxymethylglutaryl-CoA reductase
MIHFTEHRQQLLEALDRLEPDTQPAFGSMNAQQMVEHVTQAINISNGQLNAPLLIDEERAAKQKRIMIYTDRPFPMGMQAPSVDGTPAKLQFFSLAEAKAELIRQIDAFDAWYRDNPDAMCMHPFLGPLNHEEWVKFQSKHITHHFKQFLILD